MSGVSLETLAAALTPWPAERVDELEGSVRGSLLRDWGVHTRRREGHAGVARIRELTGISAAQLPDSPDLKAWYPCRYQIALTDALVGEFLGGDYLALEALLLEDGQRAKDKLARWIITKVGPERVLAKASDGHADLVSVGTVASDVGRGRATLRWDGAALFGNPTWRVLQMMAIRLMLGVMKRTVTSQFATRLEEPEGFGLTLTWR